MELLLIDTRKDLKESWRFEPSIHRHTRWLHQLKQQFCKHMLYYFSERRLAAYVQEKRKAVRSGEAFARQFFVGFPAAYRKQQYFSQFLLFVKDGGVVSRRL